MNKISRRNFIRASALSALGAAAAGALSGCSNNAASSSAASSVASSAAASEQPAAAAASSITWDDIFATSYSQANRRSNPDAKAPETPEEYIEQKGNGDIMGSMMVGMVDSLNIPEEQFMNNKPAWLGDEPQLADKVEYTKDCEVLVIGAGQAGTAAALRCAEEGLNTICCEVQTWEEYDNYACDLTTYNSKFFLDKGAEKYDPMDIFTEYMVKALGHANQKIVKDYATRSGEALDWMLAELDPDYVAKYAHAVNYKGNKHFQNPCSHSYYYVGMTQWRDTGTDTNTNNNMWPYTVRLLQQKAVEKGCEYIYGAQGLTLVHENGKVTGAIFTDIDGKYFQVNADAVIVAAGDFGGNPDMRLDLCDTLRNLAWSYGKDRTDVNNVSSMGRDGSGIRMMLWAGATMEAGPRAGQAAGINSRPSFPFGGIWPIFGNDGKRFFNETITRHGSVGYLDMMPEGQKMVCVTDSNWDAYCEYQAYDHQAMDRSNDYMLEKVRKDMANYKTGPDGFSVQAFARYGNDPTTLYAADTLEELADIMGYEGDAKQGFLDEVKHWNEMCDAGYDSDWGAGKAQCQRNAANGSLHGCLGGVGHHGKKPLLFAQARAKKAHKNAQHPKCQRTHDQKQCLCAHLAQIADVHRCAHQHKQEHLRSHPELAVFYREPFCYHFSLFLQTDADKHNSDQGREGDGGGQGVLRCHQQEGDAQNDQHLCGVPDMDLCKEERQQGPHRQTHRHAQQDGHRDVDKTEQRGTFALHHAHKGGEQNNDVHVIHRRSCKDQLRNALLSAVALVHEPDHPRHHHCRGDRRQHRT